MLNVTYGCDEFSVIRLPLHIVNCEGQTFLDIPCCFLISIFVNFFSGSLPKK